MGVCPVRQACITDGPTGCKCGTECKFDPALGAAGECTGGCSFSSDSCNFNGNDYCHCGVGCTSIINGFCSLGVCPVNGQSCKHNGSGGCTCGTSSAGGTTSTTLQQLAPTQKCGKTNPPTCGGECDDPNKICKPKFSKIKNKKVCKCREDEAYEWEDDDESNESDE